MTPTDTKGVNVPCIVAITQIRRRIIADKRPNAQPLLLPLPWRKMKQAYLDREQGWLSLTPKAEESADAAIASKPFPQRRRASHIRPKESRFSEVNSHKKSSARLPS